MKKKILFWGGKYKAHFINDLILKNKAADDLSNFSVDYIFDPNLSELKFKTNATFSNSKKDLSSFLQKSEFFVVCIGNELGMARHLISLELEKKKLKPLSIISKTSSLEGNNYIGKGVQIFPKALVQLNSKIGNQSILNTRSVLEHDCIVGNGVHIMPGAIIGGNVKIENYVTVGLNATVLPHLNISEGAFIGAGAVVTKNVGKNEVVAGNPAKFIRHIEHKIDLEIFK